VSLIPLFHHHHLAQLWNLKHLLNRWPPQWVCKLMVALWNKRNSAKLKLTQRH